LDPQRYDIGPNCCGQEADKKKKQADRIPEEMLVRHVSPGAPGGI
jgi:hypothetical protein